MIPKSLPWKWYIKSIFLLSGAIRPHKTCFHFPFKIFLPWWMGDQPFVWWVRKLNLSCFHGCIPALGGGGLHLVCVDTALAVICNQKGRRNSSWPTPSHAVPGQGSACLHPLVSGYQSQHGWRTCSACRKAQAGQAAIPHLLWEGLMLT